MKKKLCAWMMLLCVQFGLAAYGANTPKPVENNTPAVADNSEYIIGPGDQLQIFVWRNPELSATVPVRPDGKISTPLVENMVAVGKNPSQLARDMEVVLAEYVRSPKVNVIVVQPVSTFSQVRIVGQVAKPQALPYREGMTVLDCILQSGGLTAYAAGNRARIVRTENGQSRQIRVRLEALVNNGDIKQNLPMKPGDVLVVPQTLF
jgi:polysaccharide export outer membrane protein